MTKLIGWSTFLLCTVILLLSGCGVPGLLDEPTPTPRATRTRRPTFTPTPVDTPTPLFTATPTDTATPVPTNTVPPTATFTRRPPTATFTRRPPTATFTPAPPTNTPTPAFAFRLEGAPKGWPNCGLSGVFGIVRDAAGNLAGGITVVAFLPNGAEVPSVVTRPDYINADKDRNFEINLWNPGGHQVVLRDSTRDLSPRVPFTIDPQSSNCQPGGSGSQWVQVHFRQN